jgi:hypothetical protein
MTFRIPSNGNNFGDDDSVISPSHLQTRNMNELSVRSMYVDKRWHVEHGGDRGRGKEQKSGGKG